MAVINRDTDYALRALEELARAGRVLPVSSLAEQQDVPAVFLRKIMQRLHRAGIVLSRQGPFGGYSLARPPEDISFRDVVEAVQGPIVMNECFATPQVCRRTQCPIKEALAHVAAELNARLERLRLADVLGASRAGRSVGR